MAKRAAKGKKGGGRHRTHAEKTALRLTLTYEEAEHAAYVRERKRNSAFKAVAVRMEKAAARRAEKSRTAYERELAAHPHWVDGAKRLKSERNYDALGFMEYILGGNITIPYRDAAGEGKAGFGPLLPRKWQMTVLRELVEHRLKSRVRWLELAVKGRQRGFSVLWDSVIWADCTANNGIRATVSAHREDTLRSLNQNFRTFAGRKKEQGKAQRMADKILETPGGSVVQLLGAGDSLGRGGSETHVHLSEADYVEDLHDALDSVLASMVTAPWATAELETTIRRGSNSEFKDFIEQVKKDQERRAKRGESAISWLEEDWRVRFLSWMSDETATITLSGAEAEAFMERIESSDNRAREYMRHLRDFHRCTPGQLAWWMAMWRQNARQDTMRMIEMYPTTLDEALSLVASAAYFDRGAVDFYRAMCRDPKERYRVGYDGLKVCEQHASGPMMDVWFQPNSRYNYVIGADHADADTRVAERGSECYAVVLEIETGRQVAEYHGYVNTHEFAVALWRMALWYNDALIVPEVPVGGGGVLDALMNQLQYTKIFERKKYGAIIETIPGVYGFDTKGGSRKVITSRMQENFNSKTLGIYSHYLLDQLIEFGKRGGQPQKKQQRAGQTPDDGCMALALCMEGHDNAFNGAWLPKDMEELVDNPRDVVMRSERAEDARKALVVGTQPDDLSWLKERRRRERDIMESILMDG